MEDPKTYQNCWRITHLTCFKRWLREKDHIDEREPAEVGLKLAPDSTFHFLVTLVYNADCCVGCVSALEEEDLAMATLPERGRPGHGYPAWERKT